MEQARKTVRDREIKEKTKMKQILLVVLLAGCTLFAQGPGPGPFAGGGTPPTPPTDQIKAYLALTDAQIQTLEGIRTAEREKLSTYMTQIQQKQTALQQALQQGSTAATVGQLLLDIQALHKQIDGLRSQFHDQAVATLTADQKTKLKALEDAAKLRLTIEQAIGLYLVTPETPAGVGPGMGPGGFGMGPRMSRAPISDSGAGPVTFGLRRSARR